MEGSNNEHLKKSVLATVAYFDIYDYPLTSVEIWKWLYQFDDQLVELSQVVNVLEASKEWGLQTVNGFYFLSGRQEIVKTRQARYRIAINKYRIAMRAVKGIRFIPFVKMTAVCNNLGFNNSPAKNDIDFFIITQPGRLWLSRFLVTVILQIMGVRRHGNLIKNRICLSFYITSDNLDLKPISLSDFDPYLIYYTITMTPLFQTDNYNQFVLANDWIKRYLKNAYSVDTADQREVQDIKLAKKIRHLFKNLLASQVGDTLENWSRKIQLQKMKHNTDSVSHQPNSKVVVSDQMLKFHETDKREHYRQEWFNRLRQLDISL